MSIFIRKILCLFLLTSVTLFATDYASMNTDELVNLRGKVPVQDIEIYGLELTKRVKHMNNDEIKKYNISQQINNSNNKQTGHTCNALNQRPKRQL